MQTRLRLGIAAGAVVSDGRRMDWFVSGEYGSTGTVAVTVPSRDDLLDRIEARLAAGQGFSVATLNLDHLVKLRRDEAFRRAYGRQTWVVADGHPVVWLSRLARRPVRLVPGSELVEPVAEIAADLDVPVALFGATETVLKRAGAALVRRHPGLRIVARLAPPMGFDAAAPEAEAWIERLSESGARLCFLALGAPRQEIFAARAQDRLKNVGFLSVGAGLDFVAGTQVRAPRLVRALAAEWLWRLACDPLRLARRYRDCIAILPRLTAEALRQRGASGAERHT